MIWLLWWTLQPARADIAPPGSHLPKRGELAEDLPPPDLPPYVHEWSTAELALVLVAALVLISVAFWWLRRQTAGTN
jgi:hypothetical protein